MLEEVARKSRLMGAVQGIELLRTWYTSKGKQSRLLNMWQTILLSEAMKQDHNESVVSVLRSFVAKLMRIQKQLETTYHGDGYLRHRLLTEVDIISISYTLRDRVPRTSQKLINRVYNRLSEKPKTAGTYSVQCFEELDLAEDISAEMYYLGQNYGRRYRRDTKQYGFDRCTRGSHYGGEKYGKKFGQRRLK